MKPKIHMVTQKKLHKLLFLRAKEKKMSYNSASFLNQANPHIWLIQSQKESLLIRSAQRWTATSRRMMYLK